MRSRSDARGLLQLGQRRHAELLPDLAHRLRAEARDVAGTRPPRAGSSCAASRAPRSRPCSTIWTILSWIVAPIPGSSFAVPVERQLGDRRARLAHARGGAAVGEHAEGGLAFDLQQVGQELELLGHVRVARERLRHDSDHRGVKAVVCLPTYNERENLERMVRALARQGRLGARDRRQLARRDRRAGRPARGRARARRGAAPAAQGGPRARVPRRLPPCAGRRRGARARDGRRLLARPGRRAAPDRRSSRRRPRARLALRRGRRGRQLGPRAPRSSRAGGSLVRARAARRRRARPDRRLQVLPARRARDDRPRRDRLPGLRLPDRDAPTARCAPASASSRSRSPSSTARSAARR